MSSITPSSPNNYSSKYNLIQNFYIIGFSPDDFFKVNNKNKTGEFAEIFKETIEEMPNLEPKIISKYPIIQDNMNTIPDHIIINHCFPDGVIKIKNAKIKNVFFQFELDNIPQNYSNEERKIYSKMYFTCLEINECICKYFQYKKEIINSVFKYKSIKILNFDKNKPEGIDTEKKFSNFFIPKVICFASVLPFYNELSLLLEYIHDYYLSKQDFSSLPLEKLIEKIIINLPIPIKLGTEYILNFKALSKKIQFPLCNIDEMNINYSANMPINEIFTYFNSADDIIRIFKYIIFEIPILIFSNDRSFLSSFINTFITFLSPFKYEFPHVSILPKDLYGLINTEKVFIFGINQTYKEEFFEENKIELDKSIAIISTDIDLRKSTYIGKFTEKIYDINNTSKLVIEKKFSYKYEQNICDNQKFLVDIPNTFKKKLSDDINRCITSKKNIFTSRESSNKDLTFKLQNVFYKFFVNILGGYTDFLQKKVNLNNESKNRFCKGDINYRNKKIFFKEIFNFEEFLGTFKKEKELQNFYSNFISTSLFHNFIYEKFYNTDPIYQLCIRQFDQLTILKKHTELRKKNEKTLFDNFKSNVTKKVKVEKKEEINVTENNNFSNNDIISFMIDEGKNSDILLKYGQIFKIKDYNKSNNSKNKKEKDKEKEKEKDNYSKLIEINYCIFPKLIFDLINNNNLNFFSDDIVKSFILNRKQKKEACENNKLYAYYDTFFKKLPEKPLEHKFFKLNQTTYIYYIWIILSSCSLWYCEIDERIFRIEKIFEIIKDLDYIEEYVLNILFLNIYKYGDKFNLIKVYLLYNQMMGSINYYFLNLLSEKLKATENENDSINKEENEIYEPNDLTLNKRYLIKSTNEFSKKSRDKSGKESEISKEIEQIIFSSEQKCQNCNEINNIDPKKIIENNNENDKTKNNNLDIELYTYKCQKCNKDSKDIIIKYQMLLLNYQKKQALVTQTGEFKFFSPFKLYNNIKNYFIKENNIKLGINNLFNIEEKINLTNILFDFHLFNLSFDFLLPYVAKLTSSMKIFFDKAEISKNSNILEKKIKEPIKVSYKGEEEVVSFRKFDNIQPIYNEKSKKTNKNKIFRFLDFGSNKTIMTDLSFSIYGNKKKNKKK